MSRSAKLEEKYTKRSFRQLFRGIAHAFRREVQDEADTHKKNDLDLGEAFSDLRRDIGVFFTKLRGDTKLSEKKVREAQISIEDALGVLLRFIVLGSKKLDRKVKAKIEKSVRNLDSKVALQMRKLAVKEEAGIADGGEYAVNAVERAQKWVPGAESVVANKAEQTSKRLGSKGSAAALHSSSVRIDLSEANYMVQRTQDLQREFVAKFDEALHILQRMSAMRVSEEEEQEITSIPGFARGLKQPSRAAVSEVLSRVDKGAADERAQTALVAEELMMTAQHLHARLQRLDSGTRGLEKKSVQMASDVSAESEKLATAAHAAEAGLEESWSGLEQSVDQSRTNLSSSATRAEDAIGTEARNDAEATARAGPQNPSGFDTEQALTAASTAAENVSVWREAEEEQIQALRRGMRGNATAAADGLQLSSEAAGVGDDPRPGSTKRRVEDLLVAGPAVSNAASASESYVRLKLRQAERAVMGAQRQVEDSARDEEVRVSTQGAEALGAVEGTFRRQMEREDESAEAQTSDLESTLEGLSKKREAGEEQEQVFDDKLAAEEDNMRQVIDELQMGTNSIQKTEKAAEETTRDTRVQVGRHSTAELKTAESSALGETENINSATRAKQAELVDATSRALVTDEVKSSRFFQRETADVTKHRAAALNAVNVRTAHLSDAAGTAGRSFGVLSHDTGLELEALKGRVQDLRAIGVTETASAASALNAVLATASKGVRDRDAELRYELLAAGKPAAAARGEFIAGVAGAATGIARGLSAAAAARGATAAAAAATVRDAAKAAEAALAQSAHDVANVESSWSHVGKADVVHPVSIGTTVDDAAPAAGGMEKRTSAGVSYLGDDAEALSVLSSQELQKRTAALESDAKLNAGRLASARQAMIFAAESGLAAKQQASVDLDAAVIAAAGDTARAIEKVEDSSPAVSAADLRMRLHDANRTIENASRLLDQQVGRASAQLVGVLSKVIRRSLVVAHAAAERKAKLTAAAKAFGRMADAVFASPAVRQLLQIQEADELAATTAEANQLLALFFQKYGEETASFRAGIDDQLASDEVRARLNDAAATAALGNATDRAASRGAAAALALDAQVDGLRTGPKGLPISFHGSSGANTRLLGERLAGARALEAQGAARLQSLAAAAAAAVARERAGKPDLRDGLMGRTWSGGSDSEALGALDGALAGVPRAASAALGARAGAGDPLRRGVQDLLRLRQEHAALAARHDAAGRSVERLSAKLGNASQVLSQR